MAAEAARSRPRDAFLLPCRIASGAIITESLVASMTASNPQPTLCHQCSNEKQAESFIEGSLWTIALADMPCANL